MEWWWWFYLPTGCVSAITDSLCIDPQGVLWGPPYRTRYPSTHGQKKPQRNSILPPITTFNFISWCPSRRCILIFHKLRLRRKSEVHTNRQVLLGLSFTGWRHWGRVQSCINMTTSRLAFTLPDSPRFINQLTPVKTSILPTQKQTTLNNLSNNKMRTAILTTVLALATR